MEKMNVFKCELCGNMIEVLSVGGGTLACCGQAMTQMDENSVDAAVEKHVPVVTQTNGKVDVVVGDVEHPMMDNHFIQWIEVITASKILRKWLNPGDEPKATFDVDEEIVKVREHCNLHGVWKA